MKSAGANLCPRMAMAAPAVPLCTSSMPAVHDLLENFDYDHRRPALGRGAVRPRSALGRRVVGFDFSPKAKQCRWFPPDTVSRG